MVCAETDAPARLPSSPSFLSHPVPSSSPCRREPALSFGHSAPCLTNPYSVGPADGRGPGERSVPGLGQIRRRTVSAGGTGIMARRGRSRDASARLTPSAWVESHPSMTSTRAGTVRPQWTTVVSSPDSRFRHHAPWTLVNASSAPSSARR